MCLAFNDRHFRLPRRPFSIHYLHIVVDEGTARKEWRKVDASLLSQEFSHFGSKVQFSIARERPDNANEQTLGYILLDAFWGQGEVRMLEIVLDDILNGLVEEGKQGIESIEIMGDGEVHNVLDGCESESSADKVSVPKRPTMVSLPFSASARTLQMFALEDTSTGQDSFESTQTEVVMLLR
jgi:hypothetical protein